MSTSVRKTRPASIHAETETTTEDQGFLLETAKVELGTGYTVSIDYDREENQIVSVKTYGTVDIAKIKHELQKAFPEAQIRQEPRTVTIAKKHIHKASSSKNKKK